MEKDHTADILVGWVVFLIYTNAREPLIYKGLLGVKIHYIIALPTKWACYDVLKKHKN